MIRATIDFRKKNRERCDSVLRKSLFFTSIENIKGEKEETRPYTIDLNIYYSDDDNVYQIYKDMDTIYHEFSKNIHIVKEMIGYQLFHNGVISNGYDIRCISTLGDILDQYYISVKMNRALFIINGSGVWEKILLLVSCKEIMYIRCHFPPSILFVNFYRNWGSMYLIKQKLTDYCCQI